VPQLEERRTERGIPYWTTPKPGTHWVALTHGSFGDHSEFVPFVERLAERYNVLLWDLPGHGAALSVAPARRLEQAADCLTEVMSGAGISRAHHVGFSFGGMVVQAFARKYPDRAASLIAYACVPVFMMRIPSRAMVRAVTWLQHRTTPWRKFCATFAKQVSIDERLEQEFLRAMLPQAPRVRDAIWEAMITGASYEPGFRFHCPVAQIVGARDDRFPGGQAAMAMLGNTLSPDLRVEIPNAGHLVHKERPAAFETALMTLLGKLDRLATDYGSGGGQCGD
jgi:pimeloyl-ACP methyl ester carboxylesterase